MRYCTGNLVHLSYSLLLFSSLTVPPTLQHTDGSTGVRVVLARNGATQMVLSANVLGARPAVVSNQVVWSNNNGPIVNGNSGKYIRTTAPTGTWVNLTIIGLEMTDTGLYTVTVMHETGNISLQFMLEVFSK